MRCMVEMVKNELFYPNKTFISCELHDLMYDLCVLKEEEEEEEICIQVSHHRFC